MPTPADTIISTVTAHVHEVTTRTPDWFDWLTIILPVIITLITFFLAYRLNDWIEKRKERKRLKQVEKYFLTLAISLEGAVSTQSQEIDDAISRIENESDDNMSVNLVPALRTTRIKNIPDLDLYRIFVANREETINNTNRLINLSSALDFIDEVKSRIEVINDNTVQLNLDYISEYNKKYNFLADEHQESGITNTPMYKTVTLDKLDPDYRKLNTIYYIVISNYRKTTLENSITNNYKNFIKPLFEQIQEVADNSVTNKMLYKITELNGDYYNYVKSKLATRKMFLNLKEELSDISTELKKLVADFQAHPLK